jgi:hypothetical protein
VDTVWNAFSPIIGITAIRTLMATMCNLKWHVDSYHLSGASLGTRLDDQAVHMRLPPGVSEYSNTILRLTRSIFYGLRVPAKHADRVTDIESHCCSTAPDTSNQAAHLRNHGFRRLFREILNREHKPRLHRRLDSTTVLQHESLHDLTNNTSPLSPTKTTYLDSSQSEFPRTYRESLHVLSPTSSADDQKSLRQFQIRSTSVDGKTKVIDFRLSVDIFVLHFFREPFDFGSELLHKRLARSTWEALCKVVEAAKFVR